MRIITIMSLVPLTGILLFLFAACIANIPCFIKLSQCPKSTRIRGDVEDLDDALLHLKSLQLSGWDLVNAAQKIVAGKMTYSVVNSYDSPRRAFKRGHGYCWHFTSVLKVLLKKLGFSVRQVHAVK